MDKVKILKKTNITKSEVNAEIEIPRSFINDTINEVIKEFSKYANINGFRKGNAPQKLIFEKYKDKILNDAYNQLKEDIANEISKNGKDIIRIEFNKGFKNLLESKNNIVLNITMYIKPKINSIDLKKIKITKEKAEKEFSKQKEAYNNEERIEIEKNKDQHINNIYDNLILEEIMNTIKLNKEDIPLFIIDDYVDYSLLKIEEFAKNMHMDMDTYFKQIGKSKEKIVKELEKDAIDQFKFDLFISDYATKNKFDVTKEDVDNKLKTIDPKQIPQINTDSMINDIIYDKAINNILETIKTNAINTNSN